MFKTIGNSSDPIVGKWEINSMVDGDSTVDVSDMGIKFTAIFNKDFTWYVETNSGKNSITWENIGDGNDSTLYELLIDNNEKALAIIPDDVGQKVLIIRITDEKYFVLTK